MNDDGLDTRSRILRAALEAFTADGYHATSVRALAQKVGLTKTAVLYHFPEKIDVLLALAQPLLDGLESSVAAAALAPAAAAPWQMLEGMLEVWITHRYLMRMNMTDVALTATGAGLARFKSAMLRAHAIVAGPRPSFAARVRAVQAIAMLGDPIALFADETPERLRSAILDGVRLLMAKPETKVSQKSPTRRGRPSTVTPAMREEAARLRTRGKRPGEIASALGVSRATLYRIFGDL